MSRLDELIQELCPDGVEYKTIQEVCVNICSGGTPKHLYLIIMAEISLG